MKRTTAAVLAGVLALGGAGLAACSSDSTESTSSDASSQLVGENPGTWAPIEISQSANGTTIDMVVDQAAIFTDIPDGVTVESSDPTVVEISQARTEGDAVYLAGLTAKAVGTATITVLYADESADEGGASNIVMQFEVIVAE